MILDSTSQRQGKPQEVDLRDYADAVIQESKPRNSRDSPGRSGTLDSAVDCSDVGSDSDLSFSEDDEEYFAAPSLVDDRVAAQAEKIKEMMSSFNNSSHQKLPTQRKKAIETYETWKSERSLRTASSSRSRLSGKSKHRRSSSSMKTKDASGSFDDSEEFSKQSEHSTRHRRKSGRESKDTTTNNEESADLSKQSERSTRSRYSSNNISKDIASNLDDSANLSKQSEHSTRHRRKSGRESKDTTTNNEESADLSKQSERSIRSRPSSSNKSKDIASNLDDSADLSKQSERSIRSRPSSSNKSKDMARNLDDPADLSKQSERSTRSRPSSSNKSKDMASNLDDSADLSKQSERSTRSRHRSSKKSKDIVRRGMPEKRAASLRDVYRHFHHGCEADVNETKPERRLSSCKNYIDPATNDNRSDEFKSENRRSSSKHIRLILPDKAEEENEDFGFLVTKGGDFAGFQRQTAGNRRLGLMKSASFREKGGQMSSLLARTSSRDKTTSLPSFQKDEISNRHNEKMSLLDSELSHKAIKAGILTKEQLQQLEVLGIGLTKLR